MKRTLLLAGLVVPVLAGCTQAPRTDTLQARDGVSAATGIAPAAALAPSSVVAVASVTPDGFLTKDAAMTVVQHGGISGGTRVDLGLGVDALLGDATGAPVLTLVDYDGDTKSILLGLVGGVLRTSRVHALGERQPAVRIGEVLYAQEGATVVGRRPDGSIATSYPVPADLSPARNPDAPDEPPAESMAALLQAPGGKLVGLQSSNNAVQVTDFASGVTTSVGTDDEVLAAAVTPSGEIVAVTAPWGLAPQPTNLVRISAAPFRLLSSVRVTPPAVFGRPGEELNNTRVIATRQHGTYLFMHGRRGTADVAALWEVTASGLRAVPGITGAMGHLVSLGTGDELWLYGGPAQNRVTQVDLGTGAVTPDVPWLRAPAGSRVSAVAALA